MRSGFVVAASGMILTSRHAVEGARKALVSGADIPERPARLVNGDGGVIGVDSAPRATGSVGIGFSMPANDATFVVDQVPRRGRERGGWAGPAARGA